MDTATSIPQDSTSTSRQGRTLTRRLIDPPRVPAHRDAGGGRVLVATVGPDPRSTRAAFAAAREWADTFGAEVCAVELSEEGEGRRWTLGARNRRLAGEIAAAAEAEGADVIVLGVDHRRMGRRHVAPSLCEQLTRLTVLPVLVAEEGRSTRV